MDRWTDVRSNAPTLSVSLVPTGNQTRQNSLRAKFPFQQAPASGRNIELPGCHPPSNTFQVKTLFWNEILPRRNPAVLKHFSTAATLLLLLLSFLNMKRSKRRGGGTCLRWKSRNRSRRKVQPTVFHATPTPGGERAHRSLRHGWQTATCEAVV